VIPRERQELGEKAEAIFTRRIKVTIVLVVAYLALVAVTLVWMKLAR
jgi:hypothetical protein